MSSCLYNVSAEIFNICLCIYPLDLEIVKFLSDSSCLLRIVIACYGICLSIFNHDSSSNSTVESDIKNFNCKIKYF